MKQLKVVVSHSNVLLTPRIGRLHNVVRVDVVLLLRILSEPLFDLDVLLVELGNVVAQACLQSANFRVYDSTCFAAGKSSTLQGDTHICGPSQLQALERLRHSRATLKGGTQGRHSRATLKGQKVSGSSQNRENHNSIICGHAEERAGRIALH